MRGELRRGPRRRRHGLGPPAARDGALPTDFPDAPLEPSPADPEPESSAPRDVLAPVSSDLAKIESKLLTSIASDGEPMAGPMAELFLAGGKRLRPALLLLVARLGEYELSRLEPAAMAVELTHAATLVHDDVIDRSPVRRGRPTAVSTLGEARAIVVADFYFAKAYREASRCGAGVVDILARAVMSICAGELMQQDALHRYRTPVAEYLRRIELKTASLVAASCEIGALAGKLEADARGTAAGYGRLLGMAFQIADDVLDYVGASAEMGKPVGHDLAEGNATLPLLLALEDPAVAARLGPVLVDGRTLSGDEARAVVEIVRPTPGPARALDEARRLAEKARGLLASLPAGPARDSLDALAGYVVERRI